MVWWMSGESVKEVGHEGRVVFPGGIDAEALGGGEQLSERGRRCSVCRLRSR